MSDDLDTERWRRLTAAGRRLQADLDPEAILRRVLADARELTGARYGAIGVLDEERVELSRFVVDGIAPAVHRRIGELPRGRGVLGLLIEHPAPLRLADVGAHPLSYGFPAGHPRMESFLGIPVMIRGRAWGNLYLTEKADGRPFSATDEETVTVLAEFAATALANAWLYQQAETGRRALDQAVRGLEAARAISDALGAEADLVTILELIAKRGRELVDARSMLIMLAEGEELVLAAGTGPSAERRGMRIPMTGTTSGRALTTATPIRVTELPDRLQDTRVSLGLADDARTALVMPMIHRGDRVGVLIALDRGHDRASFAAADEEALASFAAAAANAVVLSRSVAAEHLRSEMHRTEAGRARWARTLHDHTLQAIGGVRVQLAGARRHADPAILATAVDQVIEDLATEIEHLRAVIADLRPPLLDDLGLPAALAALVDTHVRPGQGVELDLDLDGALLGRELSTTIYRVVEAALENVDQHAGAAAVRVRVGVAHGHEVTLSVDDDGVGFDPAARSRGHGLIGISERVSLAGGSLSVTSGPTGTRLTARLPLAEPPGATR